MRKIASIFLFIFLVSTASAYTLDRTLPTSVNPGEQFMVNYSMVDGSFVSWRDTITGGCSPSNVNEMMSSSIQTSKQMQFTAPLINGSCKFEGYYTFQDGITKNLPTINVSIGILSKSTAFCIQDAQLCPDGSYVGRNPNDNCNFYSCSNQTYIPVNQTSTTTTQPKSSFIEKFAFFHILKNDFLEGMISLIILAFFLFKVISLLK